MAKHFDEESWNKELAQPDWYLRIFPEYQKLTHLPDAMEEIYAFFEEKLAANKVLLAQTGPNWDREREPIDAIVIHHTHRPAGITHERLSAMHLLRLYAANYASSAPSDYHVKGDPIYSHHFRDDEQVFYAYHWIVRMDGTLERLLPDESIGWQAGKWEINRRSVGIVLDNAFEDDAPPEVVLDGLANLIREHYPYVPADRIYGHREVNPRTTCPSNHFLNGWKVQLIDKIQNNQ